MKMTVIEAMDYIKAMDYDGVTLTPSGVGAAKIILKTRVTWTPSHFLMLNRLENGANKVPFKLARLVSGTRLCDALELVRKLNRNHIHNQKTKARKAAKAGFVARFSNPIGEVVNGIEAKAS